MQQEPFQARLDAHLHLQTIPGAPCFKDFPDNWLESLHNYIVKYGVGLVLANMAYKELIIPNLS